MKDKLKNPLKKITKKIPMKDTLKPKLLETFGTLTKDLFVMSETDAELTPFFWETTAEITPEFVAEKSEKPATEKSENGKLLVEKVDFAVFFEKYTRKEDWYGEDELAIVAKFETLAKGLQENLTNVEIYRIGKISIDVFVVGKAILEGQLNGYAGVKTFVVET